MFTIEKGAERVQLEGAEPDLDWYRDRVWS